MKFREDEIILLLGAGASADAGIPVSSKMVKSVEKYLETKDEWKEFRNLYYLVKSGIAFSYGIQGKKINFNIETLLNVLFELEKKEMHPLYPFIGSWNIRFNEIVKDDFKIIKSFRKRILEQLKSWVNPDDLSASYYYKKLTSFKKELEFPLRIFSLNYDLLVEKNNDSSLNIQRGFEKNGRQWNYKLFSDMHEEADIYLYKLHGSIDWMRNPDTQIVTYSDSIPEEPDLIFGTQYKMQYIDPYLFLISEFRHYCLKAKLIISIGYSFNDEHINAILSQALKNRNNDYEVVLYALAYQEDKHRIIEKINYKDGDKNRIQILSDKTAKQFFNDYLRLKEFAGLFNDEESVIL